MSNRPHLMQLDPNEDAASVRDRLSFTRGERVLLVWPEDGTVLSRKLDLVLIQREAMRRAVQLALVTHDPQVIQHAEDLNISTFETIGESERKRWKRARSKVFTNRWQKPEEEPEPDELQPVASRVRSSEQNPLRETITRAVVGVLMVGIVLMVGYVFVPGATISLTPAQSVTETTVTITAAPDAADIDVENGVIPLTRLRVETLQSGTVETTGTQSLGDSRAVGSVVFINRTNGAVTIPEGTSVSTTAGTPVIFRTLEDAQLAAGVGLQVEVPVEALQEFAGAVGNVDVGQINTVNGPLAEQVEVRNAEPTTGGASQTANAVSQTDVDRLESTVRQQLQAQAYTEMQPRLGESQFIILETIRIAEERNDWKQYSAQVGDIADTLSLDMRAVIEAVAVDEQFGRQVAFASLGNQIPRGRVIESGSVQYTRGPLTAINPDGSVQFDITITATIEEPVDAAQIQRQLAGRSLQGAVQYLMNEIDQQNGTVPDIRLTPSWFRRMPMLPFRIRLNVQEAL